MDNSTLENNKSSNGTPQIWKILTVFGIGIAVFAIIMSTVSLTLVLLHGLEGQTPHHSDTLQERRQLEPLRTAEENEQLVRHHCNSVEVHVPALHVFMYVSHMHACIRLYNYCI